MKKEFDEPDYRDDADGKVVPLDAHIRLANPRTKGTDANLILRRAYNLSRGITPSGQLDMGLLFACFQADLEAGFVTVQTRLNGEPLEEYIKPVGGGYYFALPGVADENTYLGENLLVSA
jgi:deferrochelatase/peroxidase EfeB